MKRLLVILTLFVMCVVFAAFLGGCAEGGSSDSTEFVTEAVDAN